MPCTANPPYGHRVQSGESTANRGGPRDRMRQSTMFAYGYLRTIRHSPVCAHGSRSSITGEFRVSRHGPAPEL